MATSALRTAKYVKINDLELDGSTGSNFVARVISIGPVTERRHSDGISRTADVKIADETGCITVRARSNQVSDQLAHFRVGNNVVLRNVTLKIFEKNVRVMVGPFGKISSHPDGVASTPAAPSSTNTTNDKSAEEYELVAGDAK